ncbi:MAG: hypothetical protein AB7Q17_14950 [Phycisphaerae bacterium]
MGRRVMSTPNHQPDTLAGGGARRWLRRLGVAGFLFFLGKGLVWLLVAFVAVEGCRR